MTSLHKLFVSVVEINSFIQNQIYCIPLAKCNFVYKDSIAKMLFNFTKTTICHNKTAIFAVMLMKFPF